MDKGLLFCSKAILNETLETNQQNTANNAGCEAKQDSKNKMYHHITVRQKCQTKSKFSNAKICSL